MLHTLNEQNIKPDVLLLQETWLQNDDQLSMLQIDGYTCINKGYKCSHHGGLITYVKSKFEVNVLHICPELQIWDGLFTEIVIKDNSKSKIIVGNVYKPPRDNNNYSNIQNFISEFEPVINYLNNSKVEYLIGGDWNINLLKINERPAFSDFLDLMLNKGLCPKITFPTRFLTHSASLLDNIFCKISLKNISKKKHLIPNMLNVK